MRFNNFSSQIALGSLSSMEPFLKSNYPKVSFADSSDAKHSSTFMRTVPPNREQAEVSISTRILLKGLAIHTNLLEI